MGMCYELVCDTCKKKYDIGKYHSAEFIIPKLLTEHRDCKIRIFADVDNEESPEEYEYVEIWNDGTIKPEISEIVVEQWESDKFNEWMQYRRKKFPT